MPKIDAIIDFSILLNRGYGSNNECQYFQAKRHADLITEFIDYVNSNSEYVGLIRIENRQSIADSGCDVFIELRNNVKVGVQIKSPNDIAEDQFSSKVKAQYAESSALGLDKYYILICAPMTETNERKINYIVAHMATYKTNYHAVLNPNNCVRIFQPGGQMTQSEVSSLKQLYSNEDDTTRLATIFSLLKDQSPALQSTTTNFEQSVHRAIKREEFQKIKSANAFINFLDPDPEIKSEAIIFEINKFIDRLGKLSSELRSLYYLVIKESRLSNTFIDALEVTVPDLESLLATDNPSVMRKISVLVSDKYRLIQHDEDEPNLIHIFIALPGDYNFILMLNEFCQANSLDMESIIVGGDFSKLD